jgi:hypothetical protein
MLSNGDTPRSPPAPQVVVQSSAHSRSFSYVRYSTFDCRKKVARGSQAGLVGAAHPPRLRQPDVSGDTRMGDEGKAAGFPKLAALLSEQPRHKFVQQRSEIRQVITHRIARRCSWGNSKNQRNRMSITDKEHPGR